MWDEEEWISFWTTNSPITVNCIQESVDFYNQFDFETYEDEKLLSLKDINQILDEKYGKDNWVIK